MTTQELRKLIREEVRKVISENLNEAKKEKFLLYTNPNNSTNRASITESVNSKAEKFLRAFNHQPFDDWYKMYNRFVEGDLEPGNSKYKAFIEETGYIMKFLKKVLQ